MKISLIMTLIYSFTTQANMPIFDTDQRIGLRDLNRQIERTQDVKTLKRLQTLKKLSYSTAAMMPKSIFEEGHNPEVLKIISRKTMGEQMGLCLGEPFYYAAAPSRCSGFLIAPDLLLTAGHCMIVDPPRAVSMNMSMRRDISEFADIMDYFEYLDSLKPISIDDREDQTSDYYMNIKAKKFCESHDWVFEFNDEENELEIARKNIVGCKEVLAIHWHDQTRMDYALIKLDRELEREPLKLNLNYRPKKGDQIFAIGHPQGLSSKISDGGVVSSRVSEDLKDDPRKLTFRAYIDTFGGNSGSAIFSDKTKEVIGILTMGNADDQFSEDHRGNECKKIKYCTPNAQGVYDQPGCSGAVIFNLKNIKKEITGN